MALDKKQMQAEIKRLREELEELRNAKSYDDAKQTLSSEAKNRKLATVQTSLKIKKVLRGHYGKIYSLHWAANGSNQLVSASQDGKLIIWNAMTCAKLHAIPLRSSWVMTCAYSPSGTFVGSGGLDNLCSLYKIPTLDDHDMATEYKPHCEFAEHEGYLSCCRFLDDEKMFTSSGDSTCIMWDIEKKKCLHQMTAHKSDVMSLSIVKELNIMVSGSCDQTAILWDIRTAKPIMSFPGHTGDINSVDFFPDGRAFGAGSDDSSVRLFDIRTYRQQQKYNDDTLAGCSVTSICFSKSGRYIFSGCDDFICYVWNTATGQMAEKLETHENRVSCLGLSNDGYALCTGSWDNLMRVWA
mmetsp:Transcript_1952/g.2792  ORF Transcript_1952/g.2792 Transcript_1952/m.2792 type:complete len:354 (-) Transcript_1952:543-1604(-)